MNQPDRELEEILAEHFSDSKKPRVTSAEDDAEFADEMKKMMAQGEEVVFAGINPELREKMLHPTALTSAGSARYPRIFAFAGIAASILIAALFFGRTTTQTPNNPLTVEFSGGISEQRNGAQKSPTIPRYGADSDFSVRFTETVLEGHVPSQLVVAFVVEGDNSDGAKQKLVPLNAVIIRKQEGKTTSYFVEGRAGTLFGAISGLKTLAFAFSTTSEDVKDLSELDLESALEKEGILWKLGTIEFIRPSGAASVRAINYVRLLGAPGQTIPVYSRSQLPRVQVRGNESERWSLRLKIGGRESELLATKLQKRGPFILLDVIAVPDELMEAGELDVMLGDESFARLPLLWGPHADEDPVIRDARKARAKKDYAQAIEILRPATEAGGWPAYFATYELAKVYYSRGDTEDAWNRWMSAARAADALGSPTEVATTLRSCAFLDLDTGKFDRALEEVVAANKISTDAGDDLGVMRGQYLQALLNQRRNIPDAALIAQQQYAGLAEAAYELGADEDVRRFALLQATALAEQGNTDEAAQVLARYPLVSLGSQLDRDYTLNIAYIDRLTFEYRGRDASLAPLLLSKVENILKSGLDLTPKERAYFLSDSIRYSIVLRDFEKAEEAARQLRELDRDTLQGARWNRDLMLCELDLHLRRLQGLEARLREIQKSADAEDGDNILDVTFVAETLIAETKLALGDRRGAEKVFWGALKLAHQLSTRLTTPRARESYRIRRRDAERRLAVMFIEEQRAAEALQVIEGSRARATAELAAQVRMARAPGAWEEYLEARSAFDHRYPEGCSREASLRPPACTRDRRQVEARLATFNADTWTSMASKAFEARIDLRNFPKHTALLSVARSPSGTISLWAQEGVVRGALVAGDPLEPWSDRLEQVARIYVSEDDRKLIEALPRRRSADGASLGSKVEILALAHGPPAKRRPSAEWIVVADTLNNLPEARKEASEIAARHPHTQAYLGEEAGRRVVGELAEYPSLFHFSGHGTVLESDAGSAELELAGREKVRVQDILAERLAAELVVLNGCSTAAVDRQTRIGLPEAFVAADSRYVLATIESISDVDARKFINLFYEFGGVENPPEAYRKAFSEMLRLGERVSFRLWGRRG